MRVHGSCFAEVHGEAAMYAVSPSPVWPMFRRGAVRTNSTRCRGQGALLCVWDSEMNVGNTSTLGPYDIRVWRSRGFLALFLCLMGEKKTSFSWRALGLEKILLVRPCPAPGPLVLHGVSHVLSGIYICSKSIKNRLALAVMGCAGHYPDFLVWTHYALKIYCVWFSFSAFPGAYLQIDPKGQLVAKGGKRLLSEYIIERKI